MTENTSTTSQPKTAPVKPEVKAAQVKPAVKAATAKPAAKAATAKPAVKTASVKPAAKAVTVKPAPSKVAVAVKPEKKAKKTGTKEVTKVKVVRDSFTMPQNDYAKIAELKLVCQKAGLQVKKSELLRAGLNELGKLSAAQLKKAVVQMEQIKTGSPKKS